MKEGGERIIATESEAQRQAFDHTFFLKNLPVMLLVMDEEGRILFWNRWCEEVTGFSSKDMVGGKEKLGLLFPDPQYREHVLSELAKNRGDLQNWEVKVTTKGGEEKVIDFSFVSWDIPIPGFDLIGVGHEVTRYKDLEEDLRIKERFLRDIYRCIQDGISVLDKDMRIMSVNPTMVRWYGHNMPLVGKKCFEAYHGRSAPCEVCPSSKTLRTRKAAYEEVPKVGPDNQVTGWLDLYSFPLFNEESGALEGVIEYVRDVTHEREALRSLQQNEELYRDIFESSMIGLYRTTPDGRILMANPTIIKMLGYKSFEDVAQRNLEDDWFEPQYPRSMFKERMEREGQVVGLESVWKKKDGTKLYIRESAKAHRDGQGKIMYYEGVVENITERKNAEEALHDSERKYREIVENINELIFTTDLEGRLTYASPAIEKVMGMKADDVIGHPFRKFIHPDDLPRLEREFKEAVMGTGRPSEYRVITHDGTVKWVYSSSKPLLRDGQPIGIQGVLTDITYLKKAEEELVKVEKLESLGLLSGGLAHDFNNILTAILGNISLAKLMLRKEDLKRTSDLLSTAEGASIRAKDLTQQLLAFSKGSTPVKAPMDIGPVLTEYSGFATSGSNVRCDVSVQNGLRTVEADRGQIGQVVQNLVLNAQQAMPSGGSVEVQASNADVAEADGLPIPPGKYVKVQIIDHGIGIPEEHLSKIFDPYFTTKQKGSGLGLATTYAIIKRHGGHLTLESKLGQGTIVTFFLPASDAPAPPPPKPSKIRPKGQGNILVMDDDDMIRDLLTEILQDLGYTVATARDGEGAIGAYKEAKESGKPFDVVIMDLTIKDGMGGKEAITHLKKYDKNIKAIVSSGYSTDSVMAQHKKHGFKAVLTKPYKIDDLNKTIKEVMGRKK